MYIIVNLLFLLIYIFVLLCFRIPDISNKNYILHKFIIFSSLFFFQFVYLLVSKIIISCKIDIDDILSDALQVAVSGVVAYSIFNDFIYADKLKQFYNMDDVRNGSGVQYFNLSILIISFICAVKLMKLLIYPQQSYCLKYE